MGYAKWVKECKCRPLLIKDNKQKQKRPEVMLYCWLSKITKFRIIAYLYALLNQLFDCGNNKKTSPWK